MNSISAQSESPLFAAPQGPQALPFSLEGETALVTGGGSGIGFAIARCLAKAGAQVVLTGRKESELAAGPSAIGSNATWLVGDVTELERAPSLMQGAEEAANTPVTILVNNAGIHLKKPAIETTTDEFAALLNTHVLGAHALTQAALPGMIARRHGSIIFVASMASLFGIPQVLAYAAAKSAQVGMVRTLATEVSSQGVRVNAIAPGWIDTEMSRRAMGEDSARKTKVLSRTPLQRFGTPDEVGWAAVYLCSSAATFVTGVVLPVDGGVSIGF
jgi:NAD(P)-dependent dehydrogenase (short-subunit alcohol dehydrogenase family)